MKKILALCTLTSSIIISGCAGTHLSTEEVHQFSIHHDTEAVVKSKLGEPWETFKAVNEDEMKTVISKATIQLILNLIFSHTHQMAYLRT